MARQIIARFSLNVAGWDMNNTRSTRILIVVFFALLGLTYVVNQSRQNVAPPNPTEMPAVFPGIDATQITRMVVENRTNKKKITLIRVPGDWQATDENGNSVSANLNQVTRMIQILPTLRYNRVMDGSDVKAFGLAGGGSYAVTFDAGGTSYALNVGDLNSAGTFSYVQRGSDGPIMQVPSREIVTLISMVVTPTS
jgi:hypothetical protein